VRDRASQRDRLKCNQCSLMQNLNDPDEALDKFEYKYFADFDIVWQSMKPSRAVDNYYVKTEKR
jgi:hypothetical protein